MKTCELIFKDELVLQNYTLWSQNATSAKMEHNFYCGITMSISLEDEDLNSYQTEEIIAYIIQEQNCGLTEFIAPS